MTARAAKFAEQITINLTPELREFVRREAERESRTVAGQIRHLVVEAHRRAGRNVIQPGSDHIGYPGPVLPNVDPTPESIATARDRVATLQAEQKLLERKRRARDSSAADDARHDGLQQEIRQVQGQIAMAERMMKPSEV